MSDTRLGRRGFLRGAAVVTAGGLMSGAAGSALAGTSARSRPAGLPATWATRWIRTVYDVIWAEGPTPPAAARAYGAVAVALYEAIVPAMPGHRSTGGQLNGLAPLPRPAREQPVDWPLAVAAAVRTVTQALFPAAKESSHALLDAEHDAVETERRRAGVSAPDLADSATYGRAVGSAVARWLAADGYARTVGRPYTPGTGEADWASTPPNYGTAIEPYWSEVRPWILRTADEVEPAPHVPFSAEQGSPFWEQANTTYLQSFVNTEEHRAIARFWTDNPLLSGLPAGHWLLIVAQVAEGTALSMAATAEALLRTGVALHDAFLSCWTWKYRLNLLRPVTYVRRYIDPDWSTLVNTPQFPEYTSGHSVASRAAATVLTDLLGPVAFLDDSHRDRGMEARRYPSFEAAADEAAQSRLYGGIHYPMGIAVGKDQGDAVGRLVVARLATRRRPR